MLLALLAEGYLRASGPLLTEEPVELPTLVPGMGVLFGYDGT